MDMSKRLIKHQTRFRIPLMLVCQNLMPTSMTYEGDILGTYVRSSKRDDTHEKDMNKQCNYSAYYAMGPAAFIQYNLL